MCLPFSSVESHLLLDKPFFLNRSDLLSAKSINPQLLGLWWVNVSHLWVLDCSLVLYHDLILTTSLGLLRSFNSYKQQLFIFYVFTHISYFMHVSIFFIPTSCFYLSNHYIITFQVLLENLQRIGTACCTDLGKTAYKHMMLGCFLPF